MKILKSILLRGAGIIIIFVGLLEVVLRIVLPHLPEPNRSFLQEAALITSTNIRTLTSVSYPRTAILLPPRHKADVVVVGDSIPFGTYVDGNKTFPSLLAEITGQDVVNLGIAAQSPPVYNRMVEVGARYQPSRFIYCVFANDFTYAQPIPIFRLTTDKSEQRSAKDWTLFADELSWADLASRWQKRLTNPFLSLQIAKALRLRHDTPIDYVPWSRADQYYLFAKRNFWDKMVSWDSSKVRSGLEINIKLIKEADRFARNLGAQLTVLGVPSKEMVYSPLVPASAALEIAHVSHDATYDELRKRLKSLKVDYLDARAPLRAEAARGAKLFHTIDGHFNEAGHAFMAALLADYLKQAPLKLAEK